MKKSEIFFGLARIPLDFTMAMAAFLVAYKIRLQTDLIPGLYFPIDTVSFPELNDYLKIATVASAALVIIFAINKMYALRNTTRIGHETLQVIFLSAAWLMLIIAYYFIAREFFFSRLVLGYAWILTMMFVATGRLLTRLFQRTLCSRGIGRRRILFIGANIITQRIAEKFHTNPSYDLVGYLLPFGKTPKTTTLKQLGGLADLAEIIKKYHIEEIIQTHSDLSEAQAHDIVEFCREHHILYHFVPDILRMHNMQVDVFNISGLPLISLKVTPLEGWGKVLKRSCDLIASSLLLILLSPLLTLITLGIKLDSPGPILFSKKDDESPVMRVGEHGRPFSFFKFRTMRNKTDSLRYTELADRDHRKGSPLVKIKNDPRVTHFGKILRRWSLDELPQLWSVLIGNMSLVGPRPHLPEEVNRYQNEHKFLLSIKPGITGLAQVNGRSDLAFDEEARLDTYYIENWSLFLDLKILFRTVLVVLGGKGAD